MEQLKEYTETQLLKFINDAERDHKDKKKDIANIFDEMKPLLDKIRPFEEEINKEVDVLDNIEKRYVSLMQELNSRGK